MKINDKWSIRKDTVGWIVSEIKGGINPKTGKIGEGKSTTDSYFGTLYQASLFIIDNNINDENLKTITDSIKQTTKEIRKALKN